MKPSLSGQQIRLLRMKAQRLAPIDEARPDSPHRSVQAVVGVQAQDLPAALLSVRARSLGLTAAAVERARLEQRELVWTWCLRGTLHLVAAEDARWLLPLLSPGLIAAHQTRYRQLGWDENNSQAGLRMLQAALEKQATLTRPEISALLKANQLPFEGQATVHLLYRAALEGLLCAGPDQGRKPAYVSFRTWVGELQPLPREEALARLARRYLEAYAPARPEDLASWSGLKTSEARQAWALIASQLVEVEAAGQACWMLESQMPWLEQPLPTSPLVRLLPRFDTYLLGYASRDAAVNPVHVRRIHPGGGIIHPVLLVDGQAQATWTMQRKKGRLEVVVEPFERLPQALSPLIEAEVSDVARFLGMTSEYKVETA